MLTEGKREVVVDIWILDKQKMYENTGQHPSMKNVSNE